MSIKHFVNKLQKASEYECPEDVILYGLDGIISGAISLFLLGVVGIWMCKLKELFVFLLIHVGVGRYIGGFHAKTRIRCQCITVASFVVVSLLSDWAANNLNKCAVYISALACVAFICIETPVINVKKILTVDEIKEKKNKTIVYMSIIAGVLTVITIVFENQWLISTLLLNLLDISFFIILGRRRVGFGKKAYSDSNCETCRVDCEK